MNIKTAPTKSLSFDGTSFSYRELGVAGGTPLVLLNYLTGVLDDWDGLVVDGLAATHHVFAFDNRGVGGSEGATPSTVEEMAGTLSVSFVHWGWTRSIFWDFRSATS